jgi:Tfp pilus assembly protein PilN
MKAVNLLPPDLRQAGLPASGPVAPSDPEAARIGAFAVLGVLAFCVIALAAYVLSANTVKDRTADLAQVSARAAAVTARAAALKPYADFQSAAQTRLQTVSDLAASRFDWEQALRDLSRAIPGDVTLTGMNGSTSAASGGGPSSGTGGGDDSLRPAIGAPAVTLQGCTGSQRSVATLLSRLRTVRGVTRVALSKSDRPDPATATATAAGGTTGTTTCRARRAPTFSVVMFFERAAVPATVQDIAVGSGATPTSTSASTPSG